MDNAIFTLFLWPHRLLLIGPAFDTEVHAHHAAQLAVGLHGKLRMRAGDSEPWQESAAFYVPPDVRHGLAVADTPCALLYLDPEGSECERACRRFGANGIQALAEDAFPGRDIAGLATDCAEAESAEKLCAALLGVQPAPARRGGHDRRIARALDWLDAHLDGDIRLGDAAVAAGASESWLSHRFKQDIGLPLRRYVLWRRLRLALEAALAGASLTEAAHRAGFADSAHLSRTFRETFGVTPSFLLGASSTLRVHFSE